MLEIRRNRFAKPYENEFFRILSKKLSAQMKQLGIKGVLIGSPVCTKRNDLQIDALLIAETGIVIIDFKNYAGVIRLPENEKDFTTKKWMNVTTHGTTIEINKQNKNPFAQTFTQKEKFDQILIDFVVPQLYSDENIETKDTYPVVCFQQEITVEGAIPSNLQRIFHIASPSTILSKLTDLLYVAPNEWNGKVKGYKLTENAFNSIKTLFKADLYNPFEDLSMFEEFEKIDFTDYVEESVFNEQQFNTHKNSIDSFIETDGDILQIDCNSTPQKNGFIEKIISYFLEKYKHKEIGSIQYLAPTNKHVADLTRDGIKVPIQSLYSKLYDFENTTIELMHNQINEREVFPLLKNEDITPTLYILFNAHLVYDFGTNEEDIIRFGSGSLCNDTITYLSIKEKGNKIIFINDPYFYGFRASKITDDALIIQNNLNKTTIRLDSNPLLPNEKLIASIENNINEQKLNELNWNWNSNVKTLVGNEFRKSLESCLSSQRFHKTHILTREKHEAETTNKWVRSFIKNEDKISTGDVILIKNRVLLPEITDPFSIPKFALSGDIGEVIGITKRITYKSEKYNFKPICISLCKIKLHDYDYIKDIYVYDYSNIDLNINNPNTDDQLKIKQHIQIRLRELVDQFLKNNNITIRQILRSDEYIVYTNERKSIVGENLFQEDDFSNPELNKLNAKWRINKRKENYARTELLKDIHSEFFILNNIAFYEFGWSISVKNTYGYAFDTSFVIEYIAPEQNADRLHNFLYSTVSCSQNLFLHNLKEIKPTIGINFTNINIPESSNDLNKNEKFHTVENIENRIANEEIKSKYGLENQPLPLLLFCEHINELIKDKNSIAVARIEHFNYQERYYFEINNTIIPISFSYNNRNEFSIINNQNIPDALLNVLHSENKIEPFIFILEDNWQSAFFRDFQEYLILNDAFIYKFTHSEWLIDFNVMYKGHKTRFQLNYNRSGFFTRLFVVSNTDHTISQELIILFKQKLS